MEKISPELYSYRQDIKQSIAIDRTIAIEHLSKEQQDRIVDVLISEGLIDPKYRLYFIKKLVLRGANYFIDSAEKARKFGKNPQKYFTSLIK